MAVTWIKEVIHFLIEHPAIIAVLFLLYCFIYAVSLLFYGPKPGRNPFSATVVKPPKDLVTDHNLRNKVLKQRFKPSKVPERIDDVIIGSGIGALSTAVFLGRAGHKVLVLEQHDQAGGCCHTFVDKGFEFDTGIHYVGKMMDGDMTRILVDQVTEGQVVWESVGDVFDRVAIGPSNKAKWYTMVSGSNEKFSNNLKKQFPSEATAVDKLMVMLQETRGCFMGVMMPKFLPITLTKLLIKTGVFHLMNRKFIKFCRMSLKDALDSISDNEEFKSAVSYIFGDMGCPPSELGILGYSQLINHYIPGSFYPRGGTSEIAFQIIPIIEKYGGKVLVDAPVSQILTNEKGRAIGVRVSRSAGDVDITAKRVISDAGVVNTFKYLLPKEIAVKAPAYSMIQRVGSSVSNLSVFVGLDGTTEELGLTGGNVWAFTGSNLEQEIKSFTAMTLEQASEAECPLMFMSFPSAKDSSWPERYPGKSVALLITLMPYSWFRGWEKEKVKHRGDEYEGFKQRLGYQMVKQMEDLFPKTAGKVSYMDVGTPLSNKFYLGQPEGEMYGLDHNLRRFEPDISMYLRPETGIPGLYLTGQDIITCGFSGALHAGLLTTAAILHRNLLTDLSAVTKEIRAQKKTQ